MQKTRLGHMIAGAHSWTGRSVQPSICPGSGNCANVSVTQLISFFFQVLAAEILHVLMQ